MPVQNLPKDLLGVEDCRYESVHVSTCCPCTQVYFTVYNRLKGTLGKRQSLPQPVVHMLSAVGAGEHCDTVMHHVA